MTTFELNKEKYIKCGLCAKDCITYSIKYDEEGYPIFDNSLCIGCQHCFSICPQGAISINGKNPQESSSVDFSDPERILGLIKSRRSVRIYKEDDISIENLEKIKNMLPYIPTGCNYNSLHFSFIETRTALDVIREYTRNKIIKILSNKFLSSVAKKFERFKTAFESGEDVIFRNAPAMIVVSSNIKAPCANVDPIIALSYIELYAQSLGLGTCWCGFAQTCFKLMPELSSMINIPDGYKPTYAMLIGNPAVNYSRTPQPEEFPIDEIKEIQAEKTTFFNNLKRVFTNFIR